MSMMFICSTTEFVETIRNDLLDALADFPSMLEKDMGGLIEGDCPEVETVIPIIRKIFEESLDEFLGLYKEMKISRVYSGRWEKLDTIVQKRLKTEIAERGIEGTAEHAILSNSDLVFKRCQLNFFDTERHPIGDG